MTYKIELSKSVAQLSVRSLLCVTLATILLLFSARTSSAQPEPPVGSDIVDCGGRNERACSLYAGGDEAQFVWDHAGGCDRGLELHTDGICRNHTRRQGKGQAFRRTWEGHALAFQRYVLGADRGYGNTTGIGVHNAYSNAADEYVDPSQTYSITEMLDAGFHQIELDVYSAKPRAPKVCHGACSAIDRRFASVIKEIRDWMREPGHDDARIVIELEPHYDAATVPLLNRVIETYLDVDGIGVWKGEGRWDDPGETTSVFDHDEWPTFEETRHARVLITGNNFGNSPYIFEEDFKNGPVTDFPAYPECLNDRRTNELTPYRWPLDQLVQMYPEFKWQMSAEQIRRQTDCGFDTLKMNSLLHFDDDGPQRLRHAVFSWDVNLPNGSEPLGSAAMISHEGATEQPRWRPMRPDTELPFLCELVPTDGLFIHVRPTYRVVGRGRWADGFEACRNERLNAQRFRMATPRNGYDNLLAREAMTAAGADSAWLSLQKGDSPSFDGWSVVNDGTWIDGLQQVYTVFGANYQVMSKLHVDRADWSVEPIAGGGSATIDEFTNPGTLKKMAHIRFSAPGTYRISAVADLGGGATVAPYLDVTVKHIGESARATLVDAAGNPVTTPSATEGTTYYGRVRTLTWRIDHVVCPGGATATLGTATRIFVEDGMEQWTTPFSCAIPPLHGATHSLTVSVWGYETPFVFTVVEASPPLITTAQASITVAQLQLFNIELDLSDLPGEPLTLSVKSPLGAQTIHTEPGPLVLTFPAGEGWVNRDFVFALSDGSSSSSLTVKVTTVLVGPTVSISGPATSGSGRTEDFFIDATSKFTAGAPTRVTQSCGPAGQVAGAATIVSSENYRRYLVRCTFSRGDHANKVSVTVADTDGGQSTAQMTVDVHAGPPTTIKEKTEATQLNVFVPGVMFPDIVKWYEISVQPQFGQNAFAHDVTCGDGADVAGGPSLVYHDGESNLRRYFLLCRIKPGANGTTVTATYKDGRGYHGNTATIGAIRAQDFTLTSPPPTVAQPSSVVPLTFSVAPPTANLAAIAECGGAVVSALQVTVAPDTVGFPCAVPATGGTIARLILRNAHIERTASASLSVPARDTNPPTLMLPSPGPMAEATGAATMVTWSVAAADDIDDELHVFCHPASGSSFPVGDTEVWCNTSDAGNNVASGSFIVAVRDTTPPVVTIAPPAVVTAPDDNGAAVTLEVTAVDAVTSPAIVLCSPANGSVFPIGRTEMVCSSTDDKGNTGSATVLVTVIEPPDGIAPSITAPASLTAEATSPGGAIVTFTATANDNRDGTVAVTCAPASGATFPLGTTRVGCTASDAAGNTAHHEIAVTVTPDTVAPIVTVPAPITMSVPPTTDAVVTFTASATDNLQGAIGASCLPASGSAFPIGVTTVTCAATDAFGNAGSAAFTVTVTTAEVTTPGEMTGLGSLSNDDARYHFAFFVRERLRSGERARFELRVDRNDGKKKRQDRRRDDIFLARTTDYVAFSDDPNVTQSGRRRPLHVDTVLFSGVGRWNGTDGYRYEVHAADEGQTGRRHRESVRIVITAPNGTVVANIDDELDRGQIRSVRIRH